MPKGVYQHKRRALVNRFWEKVDRRGPDECWEWTGALDNNGYGKIKEGVRGSKMLLAHRLSWGLENGPIPKGKCVLHLYDNPRCVNPAHLFLGTQADNLHDMAKKGRSRRGERHGRAKLTEQDVHEIRQMLKGGIFQRVIAEKYGVTRATIGAINTGKSWAWLKETI